MEARARTLRLYWTMVSSRPLVLLGLLAGCAHGGSTGKNDVEDAPEQSPPRAVTADDIERTPGKPIEMLLMERFPSVTVERRGGSIAVRIRGRTSIRGSNEPLYVIDGVPIEPGPGGSLFGINPYDIESIEVLTGAADTTRYGIRGGNGVIVIKTKQSGQ